MSSDVEKMIAVMAENVGLKIDLNAANARSDRWQELAGRYDDIRYELRNCDDTPEGHAQFYNECARLIFGGTS